MISINEFEDKLTALEKTVRTRLSEKRFRHTLGVKAAAEQIGRACLPDMLYELSVAALLHDISKECTDMEQRELMHTANLHLTDSDIRTTAAHHSFTGPIIACRDFPDLATEDVISAIENHTLAAPGMSLFDEIIFISDFVEEGRTYPACVDLRRELYASLDEASNRKEAVTALHKATVKCLDFTIKFVVERGYYLHERTVAARNDFLMRLS